MLWKANINCYIVQYAKFLIILLKVSIVPSSMILPRNCNTMYMKRWLWLMLWIPQNPLVYDTKKSLTTFCWAVKTSERIPRTFDIILQLLFPTFLDYTEGALLRFHLHFLVTQQIDSKPFVHILEHKASTLEKIWWTTSENLLPP